MNQLFPTSCCIHKKIMKIMSTLYFETPFTAKSLPLIIFLAHGVKLFLGKSPTHKNVAPKLNACEQEFGGGGYYVHVLMLLLNTHNL